MNPTLACDAIQYLVGADAAWSNPGEFEKHDRLCDGFRDFLVSAATQIDEPALNACAAFYKNTRDVARARAQLAARNPKRGTMVALGIENANGAIPVVELLSVKRFWSNYYSEKFNAERLVRNPLVENVNRPAICLVSGERGPVMATHNRIKGASSIGGHGAGIALMSFGREAFCSYGWRQT